MLEIEKGSEFKCKILFKLKKEGMGADDTFFFKNEEFGCEALRLYFKAEIYIKPLFLDAKVLKKEKLGQLLGKIVGKIQENGDDYAVIKTDMYYSDFFKEYYD